MSMTISEEPQKSFNPKEYMRIYHSKRYKENKENCHLQRQKYRYKQKANATKEQMLKYEHEDFKMFCDAKYILDKMKNEKEELFKDLMELY